MYNEISEDYYVDEKMDDKDLESLYREIEHHSPLFHALDAVSLHGINPTVTAMLTYQNLLTSTSNITYAMEYFSPNDDESHIAIESIWNAIKEKSALWGGKILSFLKNTSKRIMDRLSTIWNALKEKFNKAERRLNNGDINVRGDTPSKDFIMRAIASATGALGIISFATTVKGKDGANKVAEKINGLRSPLMNIKCKVTKRGRIVLKSIKNAVKPERITKVSTTALGYTADGMKAIWRSLESLFEAIKAKTPSALSAIKSMAIAPFRLGSNLATQMYHSGPDDRKKHPIMATIGFAAGAVIMNSISIAYIFYKLMNWIIIGTFALIKKVIGIINKSSDTRL